MLVDPRAARYARWLHALCVGGGLLLSVAWVTAL